MLQKALSLHSPLEMGRLRQGRGEEMWPNHAAQFCKNLPRADQSKHRAA